MNISSAVAANLPAIRELLSEARVCTAALATARQRYAAQLAPDFHLLDHLRNDENGLSGHLALLLDPQGPHGQGNLFLETFIASLGDAAHWATQSGGCAVTTERQMNGQRRIDIHLRLAGGVIGIENKPWAADQPGQLTDYADHLTRETAGGNYLLVYLSNTDPAPESIEAKRRDCLQLAGRYLRLDYVALAQWLETCARRCQAAKVRLFVEELASFIRRHVNGESEMGETHELRELILGVDAHVDAAFRIAASLDTVKESLLKEFREKLHTALGNMDMGLLWDGVGARAKRWSGFGVRLQAQQRIQLRFEFSGVDLKWLDWGIRRDTQEVPYDLEKWQRINEAMTRNFGNGKDSDWWPWYASDLSAVLPVNCNDWSSQPEPWLLMRDRSENGMVARIARLADTARAALAEVSDAMR